MASMPLYTKYYTGLAASSILSKNIYTRLAASSIQTEITTPD